MDGIIYDAYVNILKEEARAGNGLYRAHCDCLCGSVARETLGSMPKSVRISASGNIIKNVKSVVVPNTGGLRGIAAAGRWYCGRKSREKAEILVEI